MTNSSRRGMGRALTAVVLSMGLVAAACSSEKSSSTTAAPTTASAQTTEATSSTTEPSGSESTSTTSATPATDFDPSATVNIGVDLTTGGPSYVDPLRYVGNYLSSQLWMNALYDSFVHLADDGTLTPALATKWDFPDTSTVVLTLRDGVKFSDGEAFNADAVKLAWDRLIASTTARKPGAIASMTEVQASGPLEVTVKFKAPVAGVFMQSLQQNVALGVPSPKSIEAAGSGELTDAIGAGPFVLTSHDPGQSMKFTKNDTYWDAANIKVKGYNLTNVPAGPGRVSALLANNVDTASISAADVESLPQLKITNVQLPASVVYLNPCAAKAPFNSPAARQALTYALDRDAIADAAWNGLAIAQPSIWSQAQKEYKASNPPTTKQDKAKAKQLLADAGVAEGTEITLMVLAVQPAVSLTAQIVAEELGDVGLKVNIVETSNIVADFTNQLPELAMYNSTFDTMASTIGDKAVLNPCNIGDTALRTAYLDFYSATSDEARAKAAAAYQKNMDDMAWLVPVTSFPSLWAHPQRVVVSATGPYPWGIYVTK